MISLRDISIGLIVMAFIAGVITYLTRTTTQDRDAIQYGKQAGVMVRSVRDFAAGNRTTILSDTTGNATKVYTLKNLQDAGAIDPSVNVDGKTPTGGSWCIEFRSYAANGVTRLQGIVTVTGETRAENAVDAQTVAANTNEPNTGMIDGAGNVIYAGGGKQPLSAFTGSGICAPAANAFAAVVTDADTIGTGSWLKRVPATDPSENRMAVDLDMGGNNINNIQNATATGYFNAPNFYHDSDARLKTDIHPIEDPWPLLAPIAGVRFKWRADGRADTGFIAQDVARTVPELVSRQPDGHLAVSYDGVLALAIPALKQDHEQIAELRGEIAALRAEREPQAAQAITAPLR